MGGDPLDSSPGAGHGGFGGFGGGGLGDVFEAFFGGGAGGGRGPRSRVQPGSDALIRVTLGLDECATGVTKEIQVDTAVLCEVCHGRGSASDKPPATCGMCQGQGEIQSVQRSLLGNIMTSRPCPTCAGTGEVITAEPTEQSVRFITTRTAAVWKAVERACTSGTFLPRQGALCASCAFQQWCPAFGGDPQLAAVEAPLAFGRLAAA